MMRYCCYVLLAFIFGALQCSGARLSLQFDWNQASATSAVKEDGYLDWSDPDCNFKIYDVKFLLGNTYTPNMLPDGSCWHKTRSTPFTENVNRANLVYNLNFEFPNEWASARKQVSFCYQAWEEEGTQNCVSHTSDDFTNWKCSGWQSLSFDSWKVMTVAVGPWSVKASAKVRLIADRPTPNPTPYPTPRPTQQPTPQPTNCAQDCSLGYIGDRWCDSVCNNAACGYDGGDCECQNRGCDSSGDTLHDGNGNFFPLQQVGDGVCQDACNHAVCGFDLNDCACQRSGTGCQTPMLGNGVCNNECKTEVCNFDEGDCACVLAHPNCVATMKNNSVCNEACNNAVCGFDGDDCACVNAGCTGEKQFDTTCQPECNIAACGFDDYRCEEVPALPQPVPEHVVDCGEHLFYSCVAEETCDEARAAALQACTTPSIVTTGVSAADVDDAAQLRLLCAVPMCSYVDEMPASTGSVALNTQACSAVSGSISLPLPSTRVSESVAGCEDEITRREFEGRLKAYNGDVEEAIAELAKVCALRSQFENVPLPSEYATTIAAVSAKAQRAATACTTAAHLRDGFVPLNSERRGGAVLPLSYETYTDKLESILERLRALDVKIEFSRSTLMELVALRAATADRDRKQQYLEELVGEQYRHIRTDIQTQVAALEVSIAGVSETVTAAASRVTQEIRDARDAVIENTNEGLADLRNRVDRNNEGIEELKETSKEIYSAVLENRELIEDVGVGVADLSSRFSNLEEEFAALEARWEQGGESGWDYNGDNVIDEREWLQFVADTGVIEDVGRWALDALLGAESRRRRKRLSAGVLLPESIGCATVAEHGPTILEDSLWFKVSDTLGEPCSWDGNSDGQLTPSEILGQLELHGQFARTPANLKKEAMLLKSWTTTLSAVTGTLQQLRDSGVARFGGPHVMGMLEDAIALSQFAEEIAPMAMGAYQNCAGTAAAVSTASGIAGPFGTVGALAWKAFDGSIGKCFNALKDGATYLYENAGDILDAGVGLVENVGGAVVDAGNFIGSVTGWWKRDALVPGHYDSPTLTHGKSLLKRCVEELADSPRYQELLSTLQTLAERRAFLAEQGSVVGDFTFEEFDANADVPLMPQFGDGGGATLLADDAVRARFEARLRSPETAVQALFAIKSHAELEQLYIEGVQRHAAIKGAVAQQAQEAMLMDASADFSALSSLSGIDEAVRNAQHLVSSLRARRRELVLLFAEAQHEQLRQFKYWSLREVTAPRLAMDPSTDALASLQTSVQNERNAALTELSNQQYEELKLRVAFTPSTHPSAFAQLAESGSATFALPPHLNSKYYRVQVKQARAYVELQYECESDGEWIFGTGPRSDFTVSLTKGASSSFLDENGVQWSFTHPVRSAFVKQDRTCAPITQSANTWIEDKYLSFSVYGPWKVTLDDWFDSVDASVVLGAGVPHGRVVLEVTVVRRTFGGAGRVRQLFAEDFKGSVTEVALGSAPLACEPCLNDVSGGEGGGGSGGSGGGLAPGGTVGETNSAGQTYCSGWDDESTCGAGEVCSGGFLCSALVTGAERIFEAELQESIASSFTFDSFARALARVIRIAVRRIEPASPPVAADESDSDAASATMEKRQVPGIHDGKLYFRIRSVVGEDACAYGEAVLAAKGKAGLKSVTHVTPGATTAACDVRIGGDGDGDDSDEDDAVAEEARAPVLADDGGVDGTTIAILVTVAVVVILGIVTVVGLFCWSQRRKERLHERTPHSPRGGNAAGAEMRRLSPRARSSDGRHAPSSPGRTSHAAEAERPASGAATRLAGTQAQSSANRRGRKPSKRHAVPLGAGASPTSAAIRGGAGVTNPLDFQRPSAKLGAPAPRSKKSSVGDGYGGDAQQGVPSTFAIQVGSGAGAAANAPRYDTVAEAAHLRRNAVERPEAGSGGSVGTVSEFGSANGGSTASSMQLPTPQTAASYEQLPVFDELPMPSRAPPSINRQV